MNRPELLAPVGGKQHLIAAVNNGADAVYMGGMAFNARIFADNFSDEELPDAINYAHTHGVKFTNKSGPHLSKFVFVVVKCMNPYTILYALKG